MAKDKNELSTEKGALFRLPDSYFDGVKTEKTLDFLNDGATYTFTPQNEAYGEEKLSGDSLRGDVMDSEGESIGVFDFDGGYIPATKKKQLAQKQKDQTKVQEEEDEEPVKRRASDGIQIVDLPVEIKPASQQILPTAIGDNFGGSQFRTAVINGERVVYAPMDSMMNGGMNPFGMMTPNITINPQNITINPQSVTMNPSVVQMNPETVTMNPNVVTMNPETVTMNPNVVQMNPETVQMNPGVVNMNPEVVQMRPEVVQLKTDAVQMKTDSVNMAPTEVNIEKPETNTDRQALPNAKEGAGAETQTVPLVKDEKPSSEQNNADLSARAGYKVKVEDQQISLNDEFISTISTRIVGELKKDGVVFFSNSSANAAVDSGFKYGAEEEPEAEKNEETSDQEDADDKSLSQKAGASDRGRSRTSEGVKVEVLDEEDSHKPVEPEIIELGGAPVTPASQAKSETKKKPSFLRDLFNRILSIFRGGRKNTENGVKSLPAGNSGKKALSEKIEGADKLGSVYDYFGE